MDGVRCIDPALHVKQTVAKGAARKEKEEGPSEGDEGEWAI